MRYPLVLAIPMLLVMSSGSAGAGETDRPEIVLRYSGPLELKNAYPAQFDYRKYEPGEEVFVASHNSNLREKPDAAATVVAVLPMAARLKVLKPVGGPTTIIGKVDSWYQVEVLEPAALKGKQGHLFGMVLTPAAFVLDLDGDGEQEIVSVAFAQNFKIRIRVREPKVDQPDHAALDVDAVGGAYLSQQGGLATVGLVPRAKAGLDLVEIFAHVEACADFATYWVSYVVPDRKPGVLGEVKLAMTQTGISDSPLHSSYEVTWDPKAGTATAVQTVDQGEEGAKPEKTTSRYKLTDGVFQETK